MKKAIFSIAILLLITSCKAGWTTEHREAYLEACRDSPNTSGMDADQRQEYCDCSMEEVMKHYSNIDQVIANKDSVSMNAAMLECRAKALRD